MDSFIWARNLTEKNLTHISNKLAQYDYSILDSLESSNDKWLCLKNLIISELDHVAPLKKIRLKPDNKCPWFDLELTKAKTLC